MGPGGYCRYLSVPRGQLHRDAMKLARPSVPGVRGREMASSDSDEAMEVSPACELGLAAGESFLDLVEEPARGSLGFRVGGLPVGAVDFVCLVHTTQSLGRRWPRHTDTLGRNATRSLHVGAMVASLTTSGERANGMIKESNAAPRDGPT